MNFIQSLKSRPISFYFTIGFSGILAYYIFKTSPTPIGIALSTVSSSIIQQYAFEELKSSTTIPYEISPEEEAQPSVFDKYF